MFRHLAFRAPRVRRGATVSVVVALVVALLGLAPMTNAPAVAARAGQVSALNTPKTVLPAQDVVLKGKVGTRTATALVAEIRAGKKWNKVGLSTARRGRFTITVQAPAKPGRYQVRVYPKKSSPAAGRSVPFEVLRQKATARLVTPTVFEGAITQAEVTLTPPTPRRVVEIQQETPQGWQTLSQAPADADGVALVPFRVDGLGAGRVRAVGAPFSGSRTVSSKPVAYTAEREPLVVADDVTVLPETAASQPSAWEPATGVLIFDDPEAMAEVEVGDTIVVPPVRGLIDSGLLRTVTGLGAASGPGDPQGAIRVQTIEAGFADLFDSIPRSASVPRMTPVGSAAPPVSRRGLKTVCATDPVDGDEDVPYGTFFPFETSVDETIRIGEMPVDVQGEICGGFSPVLEVDVDKLPLPHVTRFKTGGNLQLDTEISATFSINGAAPVGEFEKEFRKKILTKKFKGCIGVPPVCVPFWVTTTLSLYIRVEAEGKIGLTVKAEPEVSIGGGVEGDEETFMVPLPWVDGSLDLNPDLSLGAEGEAVAQAGAEVELDIYSAGGPRVAGGWQVRAEAALDLLDLGSEDALTCEINTGPFLTAGIGWSDTVQKLFDLDKDKLDVTLWQGDVDLKTFGCPEGTNPPKIETTGLKEAIETEFYLDQLALTDAEDRPGTWTLDPGTPLPSGLRLTDSGSITGTPAKGTVGVYDLALTFTDERDRAVTTTLPLSVLPPSGTPTWDMISTSSNRSCGLRAGAVWCWGFRYPGERGDTSNGDPFEFTGVSTPMLVDGPRDWVSIDVGSRQTCGIRTDGSAWCWGYVERVDGTTEQVPEPRKVPSFAKWKTVQNDDYHTCGLTQTGTIWCWGPVPTEDPTLVVSDEPVQQGTDSDWAFLEVDDNQRCAIKTNGTLWCAGYISSSQDQGYTDGEGQNGGTFVYVKDFQQMAPGRKWKSVTIGDINWCAIDINDDLYCWGKGRYGGNGDGTLADRTQPVKIKAPGPWVMVSSSLWNTCAVNTAAALYCWGANSDGEGGGFAPEQPSPYLVLTPLRIPGTWQSISMATSGQCGVKTNSSGWCWGTNSAGEIGNGGDPYSYEEYDTPQPITDRESL